MRRVGVGTRKIKHDLEPYMKSTGVIRTGKTKGVGDDDKHTIEKLLERSLGVGEEALPIDLEFDDRDFPRAPNFVEFLSSPKYMNTAGWARQYEMGTKLYAEFCPKCTDMKWFGPVNDGYLHVPVDADLDEFKAKVQLLNLGRCPKCKRSKSDNYRDKLVPQFSELAGCAGQRSAKSMGLAMVATYLNHQLIKLQKPTAVYGVLPSTTLYGTFVALTYAQAKESLFDPFSLLIADSPWFKKYHKFLDEQAKERGMRTPLYKFRDQFLVYRHRNLVWHASGPNKRVLRGRCLTGSTLVNSGGFVELKELIKTSGQHPVSALLTIDSPYGQREVSHTYKGKSRTIKLETLNGFEVEGTPEHPMLVLTENLRYVWRRLDSIKEGDWIVSKTSDNTVCFGTCQDVSFDMATILGYHLANGNGGQISTNDPAVARRLKKSFKRLTGKRASLIEQQGTGGTDAYYLKVNRKGQPLRFTRDWFGPLGYSPKNSRDKHLPLSVRTAPKEILHEVLEAYFECDSGINGGTPKSGAPSEIEVGSASKKLAKQLHYLLYHAYGILGRIRSNTSHDRLDKKTGLFNAKRTHWTVTLTGGDAARFLRTFKRAKVQKYADRIRDLPAGYGSDRRDVPHIRKYLWDTYEAARLQDGSGKLLRRLKLRDGTLALNNIKPRCVALVKTHIVPTHKAPEFLVYGDDWKRILPRLFSISPKRASRVHSLLKREAHYEQVTKITKSETRKNVYDVTVPDGHAFTANCLTSHNTRILGGLDEIGWFDADAARTKVKTSATEVYASMDNSLATIRAAANRLIKRGYNTVPTAILGNISSPSSRGDKIMQLHRESIGSSVTFGFHHPTWEMNPTMPLDCDYLQDKKRRSPLEFERDFAANPPLSSSPFFESSKVIMDTCRGRNMMSLSHKVRSRSDGTRSIYATPDKVVEQGQPCIMSIDAGETFNSFALTLIRSGGQMRDVPTDDGPQHKLQCVMMAEVVPKPDAPINHSLLYEHLIKPIIKKFNVKLLVADRWQSTKMLQDAELECEIATCRYSLKLEDMLYTKEQMEAGNVKICKPEIPIQEIKDYRADEYPIFFKDKPIAHFILQMLTIQRLGNQVVKGAGLTDDLWRCFALGTAFGFDPNYNSIFAGATVATTARNGSVFVGRSGSQGGGGGSSRSGVSVAFTRSAR